MEMEKLLDEKISSMLKAFCNILYEDDTTFLEHMKQSNLAGDDLGKYRYWEWTQGVGLFGIWKLFEYEKDTKYLDTLKKYYDRQLEIGFPTLNVNTAAPYLAMSYYAEYTGEKRYMQPCIEAVKTIVDSFPRTKEGGLQHITSDSRNPQELWDDTLFMTVLFLANMGRILGEEKYLEEAQYQFLIHTRYLSDRETGLWYHGWTFLENNNFSGAYWGRGNCWITMAIPEFLNIGGCPTSVRKYLIQVLRRQAESLKKYQSENGMWHTLVDDPTSYLEASATCGFAYGILRAVKMGILEKDYLEVAEKALQPVMECISKDGIVHQVSYGTPMGRTTKEFYKQIELKPMPYGQALAILFLSEWKTLQQGAEFKDTVPVF